jgi:hypothetical protein
MQFSGVNRESAKQTLAATSRSTAPKDISRYLGEEWKKLTADQKRPYEEAANTDRERYLREKKDYVPTAGGDSSDSSTDEKASKKKKHSSGKKGGHGDKPAKKRAKKDPNAPKRAKTAYIIFTEENRAAVTEELKRTRGAEFENKSVLKELGRQWKELPAEAKKPYAEKALADKKRYETQLATYKSQPH